MNSIIIIISSLSIFLATRSKQHLQRLLMAQTGFLQCSLPGAIRQTDHISVTGGGGGGTKKIKNRKDVSRREAKTAGFFFLSFLFSCLPLISYRSPDTGQIFHSALRTDADWSLGGEGCSLRGARGKPIRGVALRRCAIDQDASALLWLWWNRGSDLETLAWLRRLWPSQRAKSRRGLFLGCLAVWGGIVRVCLPTLVQLYYRKSEQFYGGWIDCLFVLAQEPAPRPPKNLTVETFVSVQHSAAPNPFPVSRVKLLFRSKQPSEDTESMPRLSQSLMNNMNMPSARSLQLFPSAPNGTKGVKCQVILTWLLPRWCLTSQRRGLVCSD